MIYFTSDLHLGHDREFLWGPRGVNSSAEHDELLIQNWNSMITNEDDVYILGDLMLGDNAAGSKKLAQLNGKLHIIWGNHDTNPRKEIYSTLHNVVQVHGYADVLKYQGYTFYLSHFPTLTANLESESLKRGTLNLFGHTHQKTNFYQDIPMMYNVGLDSHNMKPVSIDTIIQDMNDKAQECLAML